MYSKYYLEEVQDKWKRAVEEGRATKDEAIQAILIAVIEQLQDLKVPETWEMQEYGFMAGGNN